MNNQRFFSNICPPMAWAEIDLKALRRNVHAIKTYVGKDVRILCVIKADAYGHGLKEVADVLDKEDVDLFGVSDINEGIALRRVGIKRPILMMENSLPGYAKALVDWNLTPALCSLELATALDRLAAKEGRKFSVHINVDTGMGRLGVPSIRARDFIRRVRGLRHLSIEGLCTHFPLADTNSVFTKKQIKTVLDLAQGMRREGVDLKFVHAANSAGLIAYPLEGFTLVRAGLSLYGLYPHSKFSSSIKLEPVMSVRSRVCFVKDVEAGQGISYGHKFVAPRKMKVATVSIGYSDGYSRQLSNKASVLIRGRRCTVLGIVTMDQIMVDVSRVKGVKVGDEVCVLGRQGREEIGADELAWLAGTISYEIVCGFGAGLSRAYKQ